MLIHRPPPPLTSHLISSHPTILALPSASLIRSSSAECSTLKRCRFSCASISLARCLSCARPRSEILTLGLGGSRHVNTFQIPLRYYSNDKKKLIIVNSISTDAKNSFRSVTLANPALRERACEIAPIRETKSTLRICLTRSMDWTGLNRRDLRIGLDWIDGWD